MAIGTQIGRGTGARENLHFHCAPVSCVPSMTRKRFSTLTRPEVETRERVGTEASAEVLPRLPSEQSSKGSRAALDTGGSSRTALGSRRGAGERTEERKRSHFKDWAKTPGTGA